MELVFATNNQNKIKEIKKLLKGGISILSLKDIGCLEELPETKNTLAGNALQKANYVAEKYKVNCFADDTGLIVSALNGEPGVYSARYAGENSNSKKNIEKVLSKLKGTTNRTAYFETSIALIINNTEHTFFGEIEGNITEEIFGDNGFGYDPIFMPNNLNITFAQMSIEDKNKISHRAKALNKMSDFLNTNY